MLRVFQLGSINCLVDSCLVQGDLGCPGNGAGAALMSPQFSVQGCSVETALEVASLHPAQLLGIEHKKGTLNYDSDAGTGMDTARTGMETMVSGPHECWSKAGAAVSTCSSPVSVGAAGRHATPGICSGLLLQWFFPWMLVCLGNPLECLPHLS